MQSLRPRLKITAPLLRGDGELHIVGTRDVTSMPDPDGSLQRLLQLADGSRSVRELHSALARDFPRLGEQGVADAVRELEAAGLLESRARPWPVIGWAQRAPAAA